MKSKCFVESCGKVVEHYDILDLPNKRVYCFRCNGPNDDINEAVLWSQEVSEEEEDEDE